MVLEFLFALPAGFIATLVMTVVMAPALMNPKIRDDVKIPLLIASRVTGKPLEDKRLMAPMMVLHFLYGSVAGLFYALAADVLSLTNHLVFATLYGLVLFATSVVVYNPILGVKFSDFIEARMFPVMFFAVHVVYGLSLGSLLPFFL